MKCISDGMHRYSKTETKIRWKAPVPIPASVKTIYIKTGCLALGAKLAEFEMCEYRFESNSAASSKA